MTDWRNSAACLGVDPDLWFPLGRAPDQEVQAKAICARCPVQRQCLDEAMETETLRAGKVLDEVGEAMRPARWGIRAGLNPDQRHKLAKQVENRARAARRKATS